MLEVKGIHSSPPQVQGKAKGAIEISTCLPCYKDRMLLSTRKQEEGETAKERVKLRCLLLRLLVLRRYFPLVNVLHAASHC